MRREAVTEELCPDTADPSLCLLIKSDLATLCYVVVLSPVVMQRPAACSITAWCKGAGHICFVHADQGLLFAVL